MLLMLRVLMKRLRYPCRNSNVIPRFGCRVAQFFMIFNHAEGIVDQQWRTLPNNFNQLLLRPDTPKSYAEAIYRKDSTSNNVWRFIDGTMTHVQCLGMTKG